MYCNYGCSFWRNRQVIKAMNDKSFTFSKDNIKLIDRILAKYPFEQKASAVMPLLDLAMRQNGGWLTESAMHTVAKIIDIPYIRVYEVATFYSMYNLNPIGKNFIQICTTTSCWLKGSDDILNLCKNLLKIKNNQTSDDGLFTLKEVECLGACVNAPMVQINDDYYEDLDKESFINIIKQIKNGKKPKIGPQKIKRKGAEPF
ncbi:MAG: NADH-quinone oxidoreductase subunit NuoE [Rickettsiales bacterium TMED254]|nr:NADH-quinone oxidoreductase subunit NuoE [Rickettsiales bacterium]RPF77611.1 MAG: NADH-quinone oxidoreductase subunit NuoE [Rickettsiales bacterium TMED254]